MSDMPRILIADCNEIARDGISNKLTCEDAAETIGGASDGYTAIKMCRNLDPDVLLLDLGITRISGIETFAKLRKILPDLKIIVSSPNPSTTNAFAILSQGAVGFLPKTASGADYVNAVRAAMAGFSYLPAEFLTDLVDLKRNVEKVGNLYGLSARELEVLKACATGAPTKEVAERLDISVRTVETHRNAIYRKTDCNSIADFPQFCREF